MIQKQKILALWGISTAIIAITLIGTPLYEHRLSNKAESIISGLPFRIPPEIKQSEYNARVIGRQVMAQVFNDPELSRGIVLGSHTTIPLKQEEIADISTPTVIRVFNEVEGTITFPEFDIDLLTFNLIPNNKVYTEKVTSLVSGTGFFVDSKGHILTNAHVIDKGVILDDFIAGALLFYSSVIQQQILNLSPEDQEALKQKIISTYGDDPIIAADEFAYDVLETIYAYISDEAKVESTQKLTVLDPANVGTEIETEEDLVGLIDKGFPATVIDWRPDYATTHKDVGLIQIDQSQTPFLNLNTTSKPSTGQQIFVIGFPANADIDLSDLFSRTMTQGTVNSLKDLDGTQVYQTDAKISPGSSGSPMLNEAGEVIGIISFLNQGLIGDNFGYAVPIEHGYNLMSDNGVNPTDNPYMASFTQGLALAQASLCRKANEQFSASQANTKTFNNPNLQKYIDRCNDTIAEGDSKDGTIFQITERVKNVPTYAWAGGIIFILLSGGAGYYLIRMRKLSPQLPTQTPVAT